MRHAGVAARLVAAALLVAALLHFADAGQVARAIAGIDLRWVAAAGVAVLASTLIGALGAHLLMNRHDQVGWWRFLPIYWSGWALGLVVPGQIGDVAGIAALLRRHRLAWHESLGRSLVDKLVSVAVMGGYALAGLWIAGGRAGAPAAQLAVAAATAALALALARRPLAALAHRRAPRLAALVARTLGEGLATARAHPARVAANALLTLVKVPLVGLAYWAMFRGLGADAAAPAVVCVAAASGLVAYLPISFNGIGTVELAGVALFGALGIGAADVLSAYLCLRALVLVLAWAPAGLWLALDRKPADQPLGEGER